MRSINANVHLAHTYDDIHAPNKPTNIAQVNKAVYMYIRSKLSFYNSIPTNTTTSCRSLKKDFLLYFKHIYEMEKNTATIALKKWEPLLLLLFFLIY